MTDTLTTAQAMLKYLMPFSTGSLTGKRVKEATYLVWSYETLILEVNLRSGEFWFDEDYFSKTTTHHQTLIRRALSNRSSAVRPILSRRDILVSA